MSPKCPCVAWSKPFLVTLCSGGGPRNCKELLSGSCDLSPCWPHDWAGLPRYSKRKYALIYNIMIIDINQDKSRMNLIVYHLSTINCSGDADVQPEGHTKSLVDCPSSTEQVHIPNVLKSNTSQVFVFEWNLPFIPKSNSHIISLALCFMQS